MGAQDRRHRARQGISRILAWCAVNLRNSSKNQTSLSGFRDTHETGLDPGHLDVEFTESVACETSSIASQNDQTCGDGLGYPLTIRHGLFIMNFEKLPMQKLKIDKLLSGDITPS